MTGSLILWEKGHHVLRGSHVSNARPFNTKSMKMKVKINKLE